MPKITDYSVVVAHNVVSLIEAVQERIREGWQPIGGICIDRSTYNAYTQAVVRWESGGGE
mgnify:FL=1